jgi:hypothetical protein
VSFRGRASPGVRFSRIRNIRAWLVCPPIKNRRGWFEIDLMRACEFARRVTPDSVCGSLASV